ncbi:MAG: hypothetical protein AAF547_11355 [Actinomycetota bacterium]
MTAAPLTARPGQTRAALRALALMGPVVFAALFTVRALNPADPILLAIAVALIAATVGVVNGRRIAGWCYLVFPVALFTSPAIGEISFNLTGVDSGAWRLHAIVSLLALGVATAVAIAVALGVDGTARPAPRWSAVLVGGSALGLGLLALAGVVGGHPGFGRELTDQELAALPTIDLLNYRYDPGSVTVPGAGVQRFRLDNPSTAPHTVTIDALDLEVWVPAGRWAVLEFDGGLLSESVAFYCSVGDHRDLGMSGLLEVG